MKLTKLLRLSLGYSLIMYNAHAVNLTGTLTSYSKITTYIVQLADNKGGGNFYITYSDGSICDLRTEYNACPIASGEDESYNITWTHTNNLTRDCLAIVNNLRSESEEIQPGDTVFPNNLTTLTDGDDCPATMPYTKSILKTGAFAIIDAEYNGWNEAYTSGGFKDYNSAVNTFVNPSGNNSLYLDAHIYSSIANIMY